MAAMKPALIILISAVISTVITLAAFKMLDLGNSASQNFLKEPAYEQVMSTGTLRCGYGIWPPNLSKDPNDGKLSGISFDIIEEAAKLLKLKVEWAEEVPLGNAAEGLKTQRYDVYCSTLYIRPNNMKIVEFAGPIVYSPVNAYSAKGKSGSFTSLSQLNKPETKIGMIDGTIPNIIANEDFPNATHVSLPEQSEYAENMLLITTGKADITLVEAAIAENFLRENPGQIELVKQLSPVKVFPTAFILNRGEYALASTLTRAIEHLRNNGKLDEILDKYDPDQKLYARIKKPYE